MATQEPGIRQGCPLSPYLLTLVMVRIFEAVPVIAKSHYEALNIPKYRPDGSKIRTPEMPKTFRALLDADDTLLSEEK